MPAPAIVWFRRDLRLADNPALQAALRDGAPVIPLYVLDETQGLRPPGAASRWWLDKSLRSLAADLEARGSRLILRRGAAAEAVLDLVAQSGADLVLWNALFDPGYPEQEQALAAALKEKGVEARRFNGAYLLNPREVRTKSGGDYSVFTPFWRAARPAVPPRPGSPAPRRLIAPPAWPDSERLETWALHPTAPDWSREFDWTPGEAPARALLDEFLAGPIRTYAAARDHPALPATSRLSPHLHFGEISPQALWRAAHDAAAQGAAPDSQVDKFLSELGWREFNLQLLARRPDLASAAYDARFDAFPWRTDEAGLAAWTRGATGYPLVDAGMRQLWTTGWMHNRVRMIAASFLTKHLLIDWRRGEQWFWDTLVDADHANNASGWQWVAGSGADASPYFRIFNPVKQGQTFDPQGAYIRRWVPELARLDDKAIHAPWTAPPASLAGAGVRLGETYPRPIVDHDFARARALEAYAQVRAPVQA